ncbi:MAG: Flp pilus assembly complex ATPase component TadA [Candidatus Omnitrophica bacterium]|nr:Flp pilus assembly complex ATPase component TadA [Candidatus Omnitrophota bacterium]
MPARDRLKLGELLLRKGLITTAQLNEAMGRQRKTRERLGETLVALGMVTEEDLAKTLAEQLQIPYATLADGSLRPEKRPALAALIPEETARRYHALPLGVRDDHLTIALVDPLDLLLQDNLRQITGKTLSFVIAKRSELDRAIDIFYGAKDYLSQAVQESFQDTTAEALGEDSDARLNLDDLIAKAGEPTVVKLVDLIIREAINSRASDIHVEPGAARMAIRYRIDGVMHEISPPSASLFPAIASRLKILAKLDIAERRLPQDGGFSVKLADRAIDIRASTVPTIYGEKVVLRLLDKSTVILDFQALGLSGPARAALERAITMPFGLVFLTGPTGSGKTTTLYTALSRIDAAAKNIMTIEDPVEYKIPGINQVQAKPQIGLTFAAGLRAFLRQDPDVMMVGEVRDLETAEICVRAALTGHLVLSTLHTNDAASTITRLLDIGIEPYLLAPSLLMVMAQRLVRRLCPECKEAYPTPEPIRAQIPGVPETLYRAKGCDLCRKTGYKGRVGLYEGLPVTDTVQELITRREPAARLAEEARRAGMTTLAEDGLSKAAAGLTSLEEVMSATMGRGE